MTEAIELLRKDEVSDRSLFLLDISLPDEIPTDIKVDSKYFACFLARSATSIPEEALRSAANALLSNGAAFVCTWGGACEKVHDLVDQVSLEYDPDPTDDSVIMPTWHDSETLQDALWSALHVMASSAILR
jgi:hypothetical protein